MAKTISLTRGQVAIVDDADFEWLNQWKMVRIWSTHTKSFYAQRTVKLRDGRWSHVLMHRVILGLNHGDNRESDHLNHITLDNRRGNLRIVTCQENHFNENRKGYYWSKRARKYIAEIKGIGGKKWLGTFNNPEDAHNAYLKAKLVYHHIGGMV